MADSQTDGRTLAARYLKLLNDHDPEAVDGFVAVDYINHNPFVEDGREANRAFWSSFFTAFPDIEATMDDLVVAGDRVVGRFTYRGTHAGSFYGVPPTGNPIEMRSIDIWRRSPGPGTWARLSLAPSRWSHWRAGSSFTLGSARRSTPALRPHLNEKKLRLTPGYFNSDGTASSPHVPGCRCWPSCHCAQRS